MTPPTDDSMGQPLAWGARADNLPAVVDTDTALAAVKAGLAEGYERGCVDAFAALGNLGLLALLRWWWGFRRLRRRFPDTLGPRPGGAP